MTIEDQVVKLLAAPILEEHRRTKKFLSRNRASWLRMNRPSKLAKMEKGGSIIMRVLTRAEKLMEAKGA